MWRSWQAGSLHHLSATHCKSSDGPGVSLGLLSNSHSHQYLDSVAGHGQPPLLMTTTAVLIRDRVMKGLQPLGLMPPACAQSLSKLPRGSSLCFLPSNKTVTCYVHARPLSHCFHVPSLLSSRSPAIKLTFPPLEKKRHSFPYIGEMSELQPFPESHCGT